MVILLNEVYLAEGFRSRFVTCLPKDTADNDCHVIDMVWSRSLKKWLWMDPTFMAYVMDENGAPLSIEEVRDRLIHDKPLILNPDANHNHNYNQTKKYYLENYMAKNLYKLECPVSSEYNYETHGTGKTKKYITLLPGATHPKPNIGKGDHGLDTYESYFTNDPKGFWAAPADANIVVKADGGHTQAEYEQVMAKFKDCYNKTSGGCIDNIMMAESKGWLTDKSLTDLVDEYGHMQSFIYLGLEADNKSEDVALFKIACDKSVHCMGISLDKDNKIGTLRFKTYSGYIDWVLAKAIDKERAAK